MLKDFLAENAEKEYRVAHETHEWSRKIGDAVTSPHYFIGFFGSVPPSRQALRVKHAPCERKYKPARLLSYP